jgi:hypothetical protein
MPDREANRHPKCARTPQRGRFTRRADRQRGDRHQVIGTEAVKEAEGEGGGHEKHG